MDKPDYKEALLKRLQETVTGLLTVRETSLPEKDRAYLVLHMLRTVLSVKLFLDGIVSEEKLQECLKQVGHIDDLRKASKGVAISIEDRIFSDIVEKIEALIHDLQ